MRSWNMTYVMLFWTWRNLKPRKRAQIEQTLEEISLETNLDCGDIFQWLLLNIAELLPKFGQTFLEGSHHLIQIVDYNQ